MKRLRTSIAAWSAVGAVATFALANKFLSFEKMAEISSSLVLGISFVVLLRWTIDAARSMRDGRQGPDFLVVGVFSIGAIIFLQRVWVNTLRITDRPDWLVYSPVSAFIAWMIAWACTLVLIAPDVENGTIANRSKILVGVALFIAGLVSGVSIALSIG